MSELELAIAINKCLGLPTDNLAIIKPKLVHFELTEAKPVELPVCFIPFLESIYAK